MDGGEVVEREGWRGGELETKKNNWKSNLHFLEKLQKF